MAPDVNSGHEPQNSQNQKTAKKILSFDKVGRCYIIIKKIYTQVARKPKGNPVKSGDGHAAVILPFAKKGIFSAND